MTHRPEIHLVPERGIVEAPAGVLLDGTTWHVFYQYRPSPDTPSRWGHSYADGEPYFWFDCDDALAPQGEEVALRAGAVAATSGGPTLYFTSVHPTNTTISMASFSGTEEMYCCSDSENTVDHHVSRIGSLPHAAELEGSTFSRFRSPCVVPDWTKASDRHEGHSGWLMLALSGAHESPKPVIFRSNDGHDWSFEGPLTFSGDTGFDKDVPPLVSPRIFRLRDEVQQDIFDVLCVTIEAPHVPSQLWHQPHQPGQACATQEVCGYFIGKLIGTEFHVSRGFQRLDFGHDFTRPRNTNVTAGTDFDGRGYTEALLFGLFNGKGRSDACADQRTLTEEGWASCLSLPRRLSLQDGVLYQTPPRGLVQAVEDSHRARMWTGLLNTPAGSSVSVSLLDSAGVPAATITHSGETLTLHRIEDDSLVSARIEQDVTSDEDSLTVVVDGSTVEVFADSGLVTMASRVYFDGGCSGFAVKLSGEASITQQFERSGR